MFCFSVVDMNTLTILESKFIPEVHHHLGTNQAAILVGMKEDLLENKEFCERLKEKNQCTVTRKEAEEVSRRMRYPYFQCSSITKNGFDSIFEAILFTYVS